MIIALVDQDGRLRFFEKNKTLATKLSHKKNSEKKKSQEIPTPSSSAPTAKKKRGKYSCNHCNSERHDKNRAIFFFLLIKDCSDGNQLLEKSTC